MERHIREPIQHPSHCKTTPNKLNSHVMKLCWKPLFAWLLLLVMALASIPVSALTFPDKLRIGIYYGKDNISSVSVQSDTGFSLGYAATDGFRKILDEAAGTVRIIRRDTWYVKSADGKTQAYTPSEGMPFSGDVTGPFHVRIGAVKPDYGTAVQMANTMRGSGVIAWPAYENGWYVWSGFYADAAAASAGMQSLATALGSADMTVLPSTSTRFTVLNANYEVILMYGGVDGALQVKPIEGATPAMLSVNGKKYRGEMEFRRYPDSDITLINTVQVEQYLYGVVPSEIEASAPIEAIKAQAVAARTYAYMNVNKFKKWGFDLADTTEDQVYGGYSVEKPASVQAVNDTKGIKVLYQGALATLFYAASSGGHTEDSKYVFGKDIPYLKGVVDPYESKTSYNYTWQVSYTADDIRKLLFATGVDTGPIVSVTAMEFSASGRVIKLRITGQNKTVTYYNGDCRTLFKLPSQMYTIGGGTQSMTALGDDGATHVTALDGLKVMTASGVQTLTTVSGAIRAQSGDGSTAFAGASTGLYVFTGKGYGHGVGLSQEGAKGLAKNGYTFDNILKHYFTGVTVE